MENEKDIAAGPTMSKFQVSISFDIDESFMTQVPAHRTYINYLINKGVIDTYAVSLETQMAWIIMNANNRDEVAKLLDASPLRKYWDYTIHEIFVIDGQSYRLPAVQPN